MPITESMDRTPRNATEEELLKKLKSKGISPTFYPVPTKTNGEPYALGEDGDGRPIARQVKITTD